MLDKHAEQSSNTRAVTFHTLPRIPDPPTITNDVNLFLGYFELIRRYNKPFHELLRTMPPRRIHTVIVDSVSNAALDVTRELGIPAYIFFTTNASNTANAAHSLFSASGKTSERSE